MTIKQYFKKFKSATAYSKNVEKKILNSIKLIKGSNKTIIVGNGGSAAIASHISTDLAKNAGIKSMAFNDSSLITCLANDYSYESWVVEALKIHCEENDCVILISASGESDNICNAAEWCCDNNINLIVFSGMEEENNLNSLYSANINFWVNSKSYNIIENTHQFWLGCIVDMIEKER